MAAKTRPDDGKSNLARAGIAKAKAASTNLLIILDRDNDYLSCGSPSATPARHAIFGTRFSAAPG